MKNDYKNLDKHFQKLWDSPPLPFNPDYDPQAKGRYEKVTNSMEQDGFYSSHTREECRIEWTKRYDNLKAIDNE